MFDWYVLPLQLINGVEHGQLDGLLAIVAPKKAERSRAQDRVLVFITQLSGKLYLPEEYTPLLEDVVNIYFQSRGSLTSAMRGALEMLNTRVKEANLKATFSGQQRTLAASLAVIRGKDLFLAHGGSNVTYILNQEKVTDFVDPLAGKRVLGSSQAAPVRFFQHELKDGDVLLFVTEPPAGWTKDLLQQATSRTLDHMRRTLYINSAPNLKAALLQVREGKGEIHRLTPRNRFEQADAQKKLNIPSVWVEPGTGIKPAEIPTHEQPLEQQQADTPAAELAEESAGLAYESPTSDIPQEPGQANDADQPKPRPARKPAFWETLFQKKPDKLPAEAAPVSEIGAAEYAEGETSQSIEGEPASADVIASSPTPERDALAAADESLAMAEASSQAEALAEPEVQLTFKERLTKNWQNTKQTQQNVNNFFARLSNRLLPGIEPGTGGLSSRNKILISIILPLLIMTVGATVYFRIGRTSRHQAYLTQAMEQIEVAKNAAEIQTQRTSLNLALNNLNEAETYGVSDESRQLRTQIEGSLDKMEGISRTLFQPLLVTQIPTTANITRIVASMNEVYMLDSAQNQVYRLSLLGSSYNWDKNFDCSSGNKGTITIAKLADIVAMPPASPFGSTVMAIDTVGNLLYCIPGEQPVITTLAVPDNAWGELTDVDLGGSNLFILDRPKDNILSYRGTNQAFDQIPNLFFDNEKVPLQDVVSMAAYGNDVYMLHENSTMSVCSYRLGRDEKTKCTGISNFTDERPGAEPAVASLENTNFIRMMTTEPPDAFLYMLDTRGPAIYQFSLRQAFVRQIRAVLNYDFLLPPTEPTAFVVTPSRHVFLAYGNKLFVAMMP